jgi:hypothetical protein
VESQGTVGNTVIFTTRDACADDVAGIEGDAVTWTDIGCENNTDFVPAVTKE